jgi:hypothetical protein
MLVAGADSSTQSTKVLLGRAEDGAALGRAAAPHPGGTDCDPELWCRALTSAGRGNRDRGAAARHGRGDDGGQVIRPRCCGMTCGPAEPPDWPLAGTAAGYTAELAPQVRERYAARRDVTTGWDR